MTRLSKFLTMVSAFIFLPCSGCSSDESSSSSSKSSSSGSAYKTSVQIEQAAKVFGADLTAFKSDTEHYLLKHNNGEPIYVYTSNSFTANEYSAVCDFIDYVNNLFENINPNYNFKVAQTISKDTSNVYVSVEKEDIDYGGVIYRYGSNYNSTDFLTTSAKIKLHVNMSLISFKDVFAHEFAHVLGFEDVYDDEKHCVFTNTVVDNSKTFAFPELDYLFTPNDLRFLYARYYDDEKIYNSEKSLQNAIKNINEYDAKFYDIVSNCYEHILSNEMMDETNLEYSFDVETPKGYRKFEISIKGNTYQLTSLNKSEEKVDVIAGDCIRRNGMLYLLKVHLSDGVVCATILEYKFVGDLIIYQRDKYNVTLSILNGSGHKFTYTNHTVMDYVNTESFATFTNEDLASLNNWMWFIEDGSNGNFMLYCLNKKIGQKSSLGSAVTKYDQYEKGLYFTKIYRLFPNKESGKFEAKIVEAVIFKGLDGDLYFCWVGEENNPFNLTKNRMEYSKSYIESIDLTEA